MKVYNNSNHILENSSLDKGDKITADVIKHNGNNNYILNVKGQSVVASSLDLLTGKGIKLHVVSYDPLVVTTVKNEGLSINIGDKVTVKLISNNSSSQVVEIGGKTYHANIQNSTGIAKFIAEVIKTDPLLELKQLNITPKDLALSIMAKEMSTFNQTEIVKSLKEFGIIKLAAFFPEELRRVLKDSGLFMENKISKGLDLKSDTKMQAYIQHDDKAVSSISKLQIANALMDNDFFSFFETDDLDFEEGVLRVTKSDKGGCNIYIKLNFTKLGDTIVSFLKSYENMYYVTIRTKQDISSLISKINIKNCKISWRKLQEKDKEFFQIKHKNMEQLTGLDIIG